MGRISSEEKAKEFATTHDGKIIGFAHIAALQMAQWKDEQFAQEKQQLIDKAAEWFSYRFPNISKESFEKFKEDMKGK